MQLQQMLVASFTLEDLITAIKPFLQATPEQIYSSTATEVEPFVTRKKAAEMLDIDISTLSRLTDKGELKSYNKGRRVYYKPSEITASLKPNIRKGIN